MPTRTPWLVTQHADSSAERRIVALPHAGGSASFFRPWRRELPAGFELQAVQYPGREHRLGEPLIPDMASMAGAVADALADEADRETILFGHSMGAAIGVEAVRLLEAAGDSPVTRLCVSGRLPLGSPHPPPARARTDEELVSSMTALGGTHPEVLADPDLRAMLLDIARNDYLLIDSYRAPRDAPPLTVGLVALTGDGDREVPVHRVREWAAVTRGPFHARVFSGGHFYLTGHVPEVLAAVTADIGEHEKDASRSARQLFNPPGKELDHTTRHEEPEIITMPPRRAEVDAP